MIYSQEEIQSPTGCIAGNVRPYSSVEASPPLLILDISQGIPDLFSYATLRLFCGYLQLDFEEVERVHTQHSDDSCA